MFDVRQIAEHMERMDCARALCVQRVIGTFPAIGLLAMNNASIEPVLEEFIRFANVAIADYYVVYKHQPHLHRTGGVNGAIYALTHEDDARDSSSFLFGVYRELGPSDVLVPSTNRTSFSAMGTEAKIFLPESEKIPTEHKTLGKAFLRHYLECFCSPRHSLA